MSQTVASGHDGSLVNRHGIFGVVSHDGMARFMVRCDELVLFVYFYTSSLRALKKRRYELNDVIATFSKSDIVIKRKPLACKMKPENQEKE